MNQESTSFGAGFEICPTGDSPIPKIFSSDDVLDQVLCICPRHPLKRRKNLPSFFSSALQALMKRNTDLTPSQTEQTAITNLVNKIQAVLDGLIVSPGNFDACVSLAPQPSHSLLHVLSCSLIFTPSCFERGTQCRSFPTVRSRSLSSAKMSL